MFTKRYRTIVAAAALALLLTGCSGGTGASSAPKESAAASSAAAPVAGSDQSKADACAIVAESLTEFSTVNASLDPTDPQAAIVKFKELTAKAKESLATITNAEVQPAAATATSALESYVDFIEVIVSDPTKVSELSTRITTLQDGFTKVATICGS